MSTPYFIADIHFGHVKAANLRGFEDVDEHDNWIIDQWNSKVTKYDMTFVLGDVTLNKKYLPLMDKLNGNKKLVMGNHDDFSNALYLKYFQKLYGALKYKQLWLTHIPIHPNSLRGLVNVHGHTHKPMEQFDISTSHLCVSIESLNGIPISLEEIKANLPA